MGLDLRHRGADALRIEYRELNIPQDWEWINLQVPVLRVEDTTGIIAGDLDTDRIVGACVMDNWTANSVQCHFMLTSPLVLKHGFLECCFHAMFKHANVTRVYGLVPSNNEKAIKLNTHMGFVEKTRLEDAYDEGVDFILYELKRENCRFIEHKEAA